MSLPVALQLYSVRDQLEKDYFATLQKVKEIGYNEVELAGLGGKDPKDIKKMLDDSGLTAISSHVPIDEMLNNTEKTLTDYVSVGCEYVAVPWLDEQRRPGHEGFERTIEDITKIGKIAKKVGLTLLYHNHDFEFVKINGKFALDVLYDTIPEDILKTQIDTCWVNFAGVNPSEYLKKYSGRAPLVHLKDFTADDNESSSSPYELIGQDEQEQSKEDKSFEFQPLGYGKQNIPDLLEASEFVGAKYVIVEQDESVRRPTLEDAKLSRDTLKKHGW